jgi:hypothetical protein
LAFYIAKSGGKYNKGNDIMVSVRGKDYKVNDITQNDEFGIQKHEVCKLNVMSILILTRIDNAHNT